MKVLTSLNFPILLTRQLKVCTILIKRMLLCRKIENEIGGINFITVNNRVLLFRKSLSTSVTVKRLYEKKKKKKLNLKKFKK